MFPEAHTVVLETPFPATFPEKLLETHTDVSRLLVEMETGNKIGSWQILLSHVFQLIWMISYEEEFEIFIPGILYSIMIMNHYDDDDWQIFIVIQMYHKMYHVVQGDVLN